MDIAVYMGSFNPMHIGHIAVIRHLIDHSRFDRVYVIVSPMNPFKDATLAESGMERLESVKDAIQRHNLQDKAFVDDIEFSMPVPSYSIDTLDALQQREPENSFTLVIGGDNLPLLPSWRQGERILTQYGIAVYPRKGSDIETERRKIMDINDRFKIELLNDAPEVDVSSTRIRQLEKDGRKAEELLA